jgi:rod shape-determining protein MreD
MNALLIAIILLLLTSLQVRLPAIFGFRLELLPALVAYAALTFRRWNALLLAVAAGFTQDALSAAPFGSSALAYGIAALLLTGLRDVLDRDLPWVQMGSGALAAAATSLAALCIVGFCAGAFLKLLVLASVSAIVTVVVFLAADYWLLTTGRS